MFETIAYDRKRVPRVWATDELAEKSIRACEYELVRYLRVRRDLKWSDFKLETMRKIKRMDRDE